MERKELRIIKECGERLQKMLMKEGYGMTEVLMYVELALHLFHCDLPVRHSAVQARTHTSVHSMTTGKSSSSPMSMPSVYNCNPIQPQGPPQRTNSHCCKKEGISHPFQLLYSSDPRWSIGCTLMQKTLHLPHHPDYCYACGTRIGLE